VKQVTSGIHDAKPHDIIPTSTAMQ